MPELNKFHFGEWLRERIAERGVEIAVFARSIPVSKDAIYRYLREVAPPIRDAHRGKLAKALGIPKVALDSLLNSAGEGRDAKTAYALVDVALEYEKGLNNVAVENRRFAFETTMELLKTVAGVETEDDLVRILNSIRSDKQHYFGAAVIPRFDRDLAAGPWTEPVEIDNRFPDGHLPAPPLPVGRNMSKIFAVNLSGRSMEPCFPDGCYVYFYSIAPQATPPVVGHDYYLQRADGRATFKTVVGYRDGGATIRLKARNQDELPGHLDVAFDEIVNAAEAVGRYNDCEWSKLIDLDEQLAGAEDAVFRRRMASLNRKVRGDEHVQDHGRGPRNGGRKNGRAGGRR